MQLAMFDLFAITIAIQPMAATTVFDIAPTYAETLDSELLASIREASNRIGSGDGDPFDGAVIHDDGTLDAFRKRENAYEAGILVARLDLHPAMTNHEARSKVLQGLDHARLAIVQSAALWMVGWSDA